MVSHCPELPEVFSPGWAAPGTPVLAPLLPAVRPHLGRRPRLPAAQKEGAGTAILELVIPHPALQTREGVGLTAVHSGGRRALGEGERLQGLSPGKGLS